MKILVTGAKGFVGKNLTIALRLSGESDIYEYDADSTKADLDDFCSECEFVFHLAGVNRPEDEREFTAGNVGFTSELLDCLKRHDNKAPVLAASSVQAEIDNPYGRSKKAMEDLLFEYEKKTGVAVYIYRLPNLFGKWCKPNYNSAVATFCHNIANGLAITVSDPDAEITLAYIDDVCADFISIISGGGIKDGNFFKISVACKAKLGEITELLYSFRDHRKTLQIPDMSDPFVKKLYATYISYLPDGGFSYPLKSNTNDKGSFTEFIRMPDSGQVSVNVSKPGSVKGNHWHQTKTEKFLVVAGRGVIRLRQINDGRIAEYFVDENKPQVVDIPPGYVHSTENLGEKDMVTIMWANETFDPDNADTFPLEV